MRVKVLVDRPGERNRGQEEAKIAKIGAFPDDPFVRN
jgi:hypothetical protein